MAQGSPDAREKLGGADRLGQIIIRAEVERTYLFLFLRAGGEDAARDAGRPCLEAPGRGESDPGTGT